MAGIPPGQWFSIRFPLESERQSRGEHQEQKGSSWPLTAVVMAIAAFAAENGFETRHSDRALLICYPIKDTVLPPISAETATNVPTIDLETTQYFESP